MEKNNPSNGNGTNENGINENGINGSRTKLKVKRERSNVNRDNKVLTGILLLAVIMVGGFLLTWALPGNQAQRPLQSPPTEADGNTTEIITQRVGAIPGVDGTQVIVLNRVVLIALEVDPDLPAAEVKRIKNESRAAVKNSPEVDEVLVTANPDLGTELKKILQGEAPLERLEYIYERIRDQKM